jgi:RimJ/RimL family protein N-acetyltransferase
MDEHVSGGETGGVRLRAVQDSDLPIFFAHQRDPAAIRMAAFPGREWDAFLAHWTKIRADPTDLLQTILVDGQVAGQIGSWEQDGAREVGYWLGREYWGRGIATQALAAFLHQIPTRPLYAHVAAHNAGSRRVLEKCGFTVCGEGQWDDNASGEPITELILILDSGDRATAQ